ncbi:hypothetical protein SCHPADRAFT_46401 [Schizopora paradoxa]|uniref:Uncharacterized protein n=1 Tax=Schizopora paradoxa TaxID=27342 RepID=A0A0H2S6T8_9AGAM|nr:hypothetical protein SCHPADRAFT_46401 [Schizopora paradoxa]
MPVGGFDASPALSSTLYDETSGKASLVVATHPQTLIRFITGLSGSEDMAGQLLFIRNMDTPTRMHLKNLLTCNELTILFAHLQQVIHRSNFVLPKYCTCGDNPPITCNPDCYVRIISILALYLEAERAEDRALATFFLAGIYSTNRYCKLALSHVPDVHTLYFSRDVIHYACRAVGNSLSGTLMTSFYVGRLSINGQYYFECFHPEVGCDFSLLSESLKSQHRGIEHIDVLPLHDNVVMSIGFDNTPFSSSGHFPILACLDGSGEPLYLAFVRDREWRLRFATGREGESTITYHDEFGNGVKSAKFEVLVLRHDPVDFEFDIYEDDPLRKFAKDPTGLLYWLRYFPDRAPEVDNDPPERLNATGPLVELKDSLFEWMDELNLGSGWGSALGQEYTYYDTEVVFGDTSCDSTRIASGDGSELAPSR